MAEFSYRGRDSQGILVTGTRKANSADDLAQRLVLENITPIDIDEAKRQKTKTAFQLPTLFKAKVSDDDLHLFCRQMYTLTKAGIPIGSAIERLSETVHDKLFGEALKQIYLSINEGHSLAYALGQHHHIFTSFFVNVIKVGESSGQLDSIFLQLANHLSLDIETKKKIKSATRYPLLVLVATVVAILVINALVIPSFAKMFARYKGELPFATKILIVTSNIITGYWYIILGSVVLFIVAFRYYLKTPIGRLQWDKIKLKIPLIGWLIHRLLLARFARLYALVLRSGITALEGIEMIGLSLGNAFISSRIQSISQLIARGNSIANACAQAELFSPLVLQMVSLGEQTGKLDDLLDDVADYYERETAYDLVRLSDAIEPILLLIMASMVLVLAFGVFLPMWDMVSLVAK